MAHSGEDGRALPTLNPGEVFAGRYRVEKPLGQGVLGQLYQVKHLKYGQTLVLKVYYPGAVASAEARNTFKSEFDRLKQLKHAGVVRYFEQGDWPEANTKYCTMEFINGSNLRTLMNELKKTGTPMAPPDAIAIILKLLETLKAVHPSGVTHRNVKPEEVLIVARGKARDKVAWDLRLSDFALANAPAEWITEVPHEKLVYMPPEVRGYEGQVGPRSDLYSVGSLFYEMVTGREWDESTPASKVKNTLPKKLDDVLELALATSVNDRFGSADAMFLEVEQLSSLAFEGEKGKMSRFAPLYILVGLLALGAFIFYLYNLKPEPKDVPIEERWAQLRQNVTDSPRFRGETDEQVAEKQAKDPKMVYVPAGLFLSGALPEEPNARGTDPRAELRSAEGTKLNVVELKGFYIDKYEFPNEPGQPALTALNYTEAEEKCNTLGKRLCTSQEWERACKGEKLTIYAYGDAYDPTKCPADTEKVDSAPDCRSSFGVVNLSGGIAEWTFGAAAGAEDRRIVKGGDPGSEPWGTRCAAVKDDVMSIRDPKIGFRCCK